MPISNTMAISLCYNWTRWEANDVNYMYYSIVSHSWNCNKCMDEEHKHPTVLSFFLSNIVDVTVLPTGPPHSHSIININISLAAEEDALWRGGEFCSDYGRMLSTTGSHISKHKLFYRVPSIHLARFQCFLITTGWFNWVDFNVKWKGEKRIFLETHSTLLHYSWINHKLEPRYTNEHDFRYWLLYRCLIMSPSGTTCVPLIISPGFQQWVFCVSPNRTLCSK